MDFEPDEARAVIRRFARETAGLGLEMVQLRGRMREAGDAPSATACCASSTRPAAASSSRSTTRRREPLQPLDEGAQRIVSARRRGMVHPAEIVKMLAPSAPSPARDPGRRVRRARPRRATGELVAGRPARRPRTRASIVVGLIRNRTERYPEGMLRVVLLGDPTRVARLAGRARVPAGDRRARPRRARSTCRSSGSRCPSGAQDRDGLRHGEHGLGRGRRCGGSSRFTQAGGEINVVVTGINVGAQPYWNAEATMLMHTKGILVMTPESAMVLTGKQALDYSGGVSAEDNFGIGGYERDHGPERPGAVLGARPRGRLRGPARLLRAHLRRAGRALPAPRRDRRPARPRRRPVAARARPTRTSRPSARSSPRRRTRAARSRSTSAR